MFTNGARLMDNRHFTVDAHIHYALPFRPEELVKIMDDTGTDMGNLVVVPHRQRLSSVPDALMAKDMYKERFYVFASLDVSVYYRYRDKVGTKMAEYAEAMLGCGCDGIKIIEGKPAMRKMMPVPDWDAPVWDAFFAWCEEKQVPILWHVNDPETFWDEKNAPSWAKERGWFYDDSFINNEAQYGQVLRLLEHHPKLKIIFAHFFFMSAQQDRLDAIMQKYPNIMVDLTPGIEMYENFSKDIVSAGTFINKYSKRIVYGTDIGARGVLSENGGVSYEESLERAELVQAFLTGSGERSIPGDGIFLADGCGFTMKCLGLDNEAAADILGCNFLRFVGGRPAAVSRRRVLMECRRIRITLRIMSFIDKELKADASCVRQVEKYFRKRKF